MKRNLMLLILLASTNVVAGEHVDKTMLIKELKNSSRVFSEPDDCQIKFVDESGTSKKTISITIKDEYGTQLNEVAPVYKGGKVFLDQKFAETDGSFEYIYSLNDGSWIRFTSVDDASYAVEVFSYQQGMSATCVAEF